MMLSRLRLEKTSALTFYERDFSGRVFNSGWTHTDQHFNKNKGTKAEPREY